MIEKAVWHELVVDDQVGAAQAFHCAHGQQPGITRSRSDEINSRRSFGQWRLLLTRQGRAPFQ
jgi:hypothetical protein